MAPPPAPATARGFARSPTRRSAKVPLSPRPVSINRQGPRTGLPAAPASLTRRLSGLVGPLGSRTMAARPPPRRPRASLSPPPRQTPTLCDPQAHSDNINCILVCHVGVRAACSKFTPWQCMLKVLLLGSARARLLRLLRLRARLVALGGSTLSCEELSPTASGARARRLQSRRSHRLRPSRCACPRVVASRCSVVAGRRHPRPGSGHRASYASRTRRSCTERGTITLRRAGACCTPTRA